MLAPMYSCEQDRHTAAARPAYDDDNTNHLQPCAAGPSLQLPAHNQRAQVDPAGSVAGVRVPQTQRVKKKHRSSTTVVSTDVANFRATVQELTGFPPAAIFRPLPRRVHAVGNPFATLAAGNQAGCGGGGRGQGSQTTTNTAVQPAPVMAQCAPPPGVFDGLLDIGSPEFDSWADLSIE